MSLIKYKGRYYYGSYQKEKDIFMVRTKNETEGFTLYYDEYRMYIKTTEVEEYFDLKYYARVREKDQEVISTKDYLNTLDIYAPYAWEKYFEPIARFDIGFGVLRVPIDNVEYIIREIKSYKSPDFDYEKPKPEPVRTKLTVEEFQEYNGSIVNNLCWYNENY